MQNINLQEAGKEYGPTGYWFYNCFGFIEHKFVREKGDLFSESRGQVYRVPSEGIVQAIESQYVRLFSDDGVQPSIRETTS